MAKVVLSFGSNIEPRCARLEDALGRVCRYPLTRLLAASEIEETEPQGVPDEFRHVKFMNRVAIFETGLSAEDFSVRMHSTEDEMGRVRGDVRNLPRTIDIDMVDYGGTVSDSPELTLPHPLAHERDFVMRPWMELEKKLVRDEMKRLRSAVPPAERAAKSHELCLKLLDLLGGVKLVCVYRALKTELDISEFERECIRRGIEIAVPEKTRDGYAVLRCGEVDLWVCPGLAFTEKGERLGFGGGWYDRFLASAKSGAKACGVAYSFQIRPWLPQGPWDRRLDAIVTV